MNSTLFCIVWRSGGTDNATWHRSTPYPTLAIAEQRQAKVERMGYRALVVDYHQSLAIGLPEGFDTDAQEAK